MSQKSVPVVSAVLGVFAVGVAIGWLSPGASTANQTKAPDSNTEAARTAQQVNADTPEPEPASSEPRADFDARLKAVFATGNRLKRQRAGAAIADGLDVEQVRAALAKIARIHSAEQGVIRQRLYSRWAQLDPQAALAHARETKDSGDAIYTVMNSWALTDPEGAEGALQAVEKTANQLTRGRAVAGVTEALAETNPKRAFELAEKFDTYSNVIFKNWAAKDPEEAAAFAAKADAGTIRGMAIEAVAGVWAETDVSRTLQWLESLPAADTAGGRGTDSPFAPVLAKWMDEDPEAAMRWLAQRPNDSQTARLVARTSTDLIYGIGDPLLSAKVISMLPAGESRSAAWNTLMMIWQGEDPEGAIAWAESQADDVRREVLPRLAWRLGERDPEKGLKLATGLGDKGAQALESVISGWASRQPAAAAEWLRGQPPNQDALAAVASRWIERDSAKATEWINSVENGPAKDHALQHVADNNWAWHPEIAVEWIAGIGDEKKRNKAYKNIVGLWLDNDPAAARKWIETSPMPEPMKTKFLKGVEE